jgi:excisionase family DNA binding protein
VRTPHQGNDGEHPLDRSRPDREPDDRIETPTQIEATMRKHNEETALLTPSEVAILFRVSPKTVTRWAKEGKLPYIRTLGGHRRYPARDVRALAEAGFEDPVAAAS